MLEGFGLFEKRVIGRAGSPLLTRITLLRTPWFTVKVHRFHRSDPSCLHDHPWNFLTVILRSGYYEQYEGPDGNLLEGWRAPGTALYRPASFRHRVVVHPGKEEPVTLVITGRKFRLWGFWTRAKGWMPFSLFSQDEDDCGTRGVVAEEEVADEVFGMGPQPVYMESVED